MTDNQQTDEMREAQWRVSQSGNPNKAWLVCGGKKISALMSLQAARDLAYIHNTTVDFEVLKSCKDERRVVATRYEAALREAREALETIGKTHDGGACDLTLFTMLTSAQAIANIDKSLGDKP